jgi:hypothetical protein
MTREGDCAVFHQTCARVTNTGLREICKAKGIPGYSRMTKEDLVDTCCKGGGKAMPENLQAKVVTLPLGEVEDMDDRGVIQLAFRRLLDTADSSERYRVFASKRRSCPTGSRPGQSAEELLEELRRRGPLYLVEDEPDLDGACAGRCLRQESEYTCGVRVQNTFSTVRGGRDPAEDAAVLFFANYPEGQEMVKRARARCPNDIEAFWKVKEGMRGEVEEWGDEEISWIDGGDYGEEYISGDLEYGCEENSLILRRGLTSDKYDSRAFGGEDLEYDRANHYEFERREEEILREMGRPLSAERLRSILGDEATIKVIAPAAAIQDKSFEVESRAEISYPPLSGEGDAEELARKLEELRSVL